MDQALSCINLLEAITEWNGVERRGLPLSEQHAAAHYRGFQSI